MSQGEKSVKCPHRDKGSKISSCPGKQKKMYLEASLQEEGIFYCSIAEEASVRLVHLVH